MSQQPEGNTMPVTETAQSRYNRVTDQIETLRVEITNIEDRIAEMNGAPGFNTRTDPADTQSLTELRARIIELGHVQDDIYIYNLEVTRTGPNGTPQDLNNLKSNSVTTAAQADALQSGSKRK
jgi:hypothetical protein